MLKIALHIVGDYIDKVCGSCEVTLLKSNTCISLLHGKVGTQNKMKHVKMILGDYVLKTYHPPWVEF